MLLLLLLLLLLSSLRYLLVDLSAAITNSKLISRLAPGLWTVRQHTMAHDPEIGRRFDEEHVQQRKTQGRAESALSTRKTRGAVDATPRDSIRGATSRNPWLV